MRRIVLTGGPGAGKTVITTLLSQRFPDRFVRVPEAATQVYDHLRTRWDRLDLEGRRAVQRRIYRTQRAQEDALAIAHSDKTLLLDRGTIDGAAYWPDGPMEYWQDLGTKHEEELARYDAILWMQTSAVLGIYDGDASNSCRFEDPQAAIESGALLRTLWSDHRHFFKVDAHPKLEDKVGDVLRVIEELI